MMNAVLVDRWKEKETETDRKTWLNWAFKGIGLTNAATKE